MIDHAPTPWKFGNTGPEQRMILDANDNYVASVQIFQTPRQMGEWQEQQREASAAFILRSVNSRGDLIEALQECEEYFDQRADAEYFTDSASPHPNKEMTLLTLVRDAIAKATS
jgi:hypothetical protein